MRTDKREGRGERGDKGQGRGEQEGRREEREGRREKTEKWGGGGRGIAMTSPQGREAIIIMVVIVSLYTW